ESRPVSVARLSSGARHAATVSLMSAAPRDMSRRCNEGSGLARPQRCQRADSLVRVTLRTTASGTQGSQHGGGSGPQRNTAVHGASADEERSGERHDGAFHEIRGPHLARPAEDDRGLQDIERAESQAAQHLLELAFGPQVAALRATSAPLAEITTKR